MCPARPAVMGTCWDVSGTTCRDGDVLGCVRHVRIHAAPGGMCPARAGVYAAPRERERERESTCRRIRGEESACMRARRVCGPGVYVGPACMRARRVCGPGVYAGPA